MDVYFEKIAGVADTRPRLANPGPDSAGSLLEDTALDDDGFPVSPLGEQDQLWFVMASRLHKPLARAANTARVSGLTMIISGAFASLGGAVGLMLGGGPLPLVLGLMLVTLGTIERSGASDMASADPKAPARLARNQGFLFILVALGGWASGVATSGMSELDAMLAEGALPPELSGLQNALRVAAPVIALGPLGFAVVLGLLFQGGLSMFYLSRRRLIRRFHAELPPWVTRVVVEICGR